MSRGRDWKPRRTDDGRDLGVTIAILGAEKNNATIGPEKAETNDSGEKEAEEGKEHPVLAHLNSD